MDNLNTNLFGVMNVTSALLPLLKKGKGKQIFGVSSTCGSIGGPFGENPMATACESCMEDPIARGRLILHAPTLQTASRRLL